MIVLKFLERNNCFQKLVRDRGSITLKWMPEVSIFVDLYKWKQPRYACSWEFLDLVRDSLMNFEGSSIINYLTQEAILSNGLINVKSIFLNIEMIDDHNFSIWPCLVDSTNMVLIWRIWPVLLFSRICVKIHQYSGYDKFIMYSEARTRDKTCVNSKW